MLERLWSRAKYATNGQNGNHSLSAADMEKAKASVRNDRVEAFLNAYPYVDKWGNSLNVAEEDRWKPDYVIRKPTLQEDVALLLDAFGCETDFNSWNVHVGKDIPVEKLLKGVELDERRYRGLKAIGVRKEGLAKARRMEQ